MSKGPIPKIVDLTAPEHDDSVEGARDPQLTGEKTRADEKTPQDAPRTPKEPREARQRMRCEMPQPAGQAPSCAKNILVLTLQGNAGGTADRSTPPGASVTGCNGVSGNPVDLFDVCRIDAERHRLDVRGMCGDPLQERHEHRLVPQIALPVRSNNSNAESD